jgi:hypothetical protein
MTNTASHPMIHKIEALAGKLTPKGKILGDFLHREPSERPFS